MKIGFVSLGCSKNLVDTENIMGIFKKNKFDIVNNPRQAQIIIINTCGFIQAAKEEAINTILEMAEYKQKNCKYLIVIGCLVQRYKSQLEKLIPEVDLFINIDDYEKLPEKIEDLLKPELEEKNSIYKNIEYKNRIISTGSKMAYLKIAEGCSNNCTYCAIPYIRGPFKSIPMEDLINEAKGLAKSGIEELIVIAQDTTKYGVDLYGKSTLPELLEKLCDIKDLKWIRFLYAYPEGITQELINVVKQNKKICNYFDIPIQHASDKILKLMNRKNNYKTTIELINNIRQNTKDVIIRTSLIVGFPGETKEDFEILYDFVNNIEFDRLGVFMYSKEDGTPAEKLKNQIHHNVKKSRYNKIMKLQKQIVNKKFENYVGKEYMVLIEKKTFDNKYYIGRTANDVPDMDGVIYIKNDTDEDLIDKFINCVVIDFKDYDLIGEVIK